MTDYSDNGWPVVDSAAVDTGFSVAGVTFPGGIRAGNVAAVFRYFITQYHARVEPLVAGWCWGYEVRDNVNSPGSASCHSSATAADLNAPDHPNGARGTFTSAQVATIRQIQAECPAFLWGGDFSGTPDEMHVQIANNLTDADLAAIVAALPDTPAPPDTGGFLMALTDEQQEDLYTWVKDLRSNLIPSGIADGQTTVGGTITASLKQSQANQNDLNTILSRLD